MPARDAVPAEAGGAAWLPGAEEAPAAYLESHALDEAPWPAPAPPGEEPSLPIWRPTAESELAATTAEAPAPEAGAIPADDGATGDLSLPVWEPAAAEQAPPVDEQAQPGDEAIPAPTIAWADPAPEVDAADPAPLAAPEPIDRDPPATLREPEPEPELEGEPVVVAEPAPAWDPAPAQLPPAAEAAPALAEQSAEVARLVPDVLGALRPLVGVSDHVGPTPRMLVVLRALVERPMSIGEQATLLGVSRPVVADVTARLEQEGLVRRERDQRDRRRVRAAPTAAGRRVADECGGGPPPEVVAAALARMEPAERQALVSSLRPLGRAAAPAASA